MRRVGRAVAAAMLLCGGAPAWAQAIGGGVDVATDENRRGLSWSDGRVSPSADLFATLGGFEASARVASLRGSARHGGADAVGDLSVGHRWMLGPVNLRAQGIAHLFAGADGRQDFVEGGVDADYAIGPLQLGAGGLVAPAQRAVGGTNWHLFASAAAAVPGTPVTVNAGVGRTSGPDDRARADRLRPGGDYTNWRLGAEYNQLRWSLALDYIGSDVDMSRIGPLGDRWDDASDRLVARARLSF
ncbi:MAG: hypothetical protein DI610_05020 [Staphylococcus hominis]|nr:MAG: hypothetical protein DI610_05020 [Staphylococcus hominis]